MISLNLFIIALLTSMIQDTKILASLLVSYFSPENLLLEMKRKSG